MMMHMTIKKIISRSLCGYSFSLFLTVVAALDWIPASWGDYGNKLHIGIGLLIAFMKAAMVVYIFMHIKFDHKFIRLFIGIPLFLFSVMVFAFTALESFY